MPRVLLLVSKLAYQTDDLLAAAGRLGVEALLASDRCHLLAEEWPAGAWALDFRDPQRAAEQIAARGERVDGVVATDEKTAVIAQLAAERLGLRHNPRAAILAAANKLALRRALSLAGLPQPGFSEVTTAAEAARAAAALGYPVVVKPLHLSASRGVMRADDPADLSLRVARLVRLLADPTVAASDPDAAARFLVEAFVPGPEVALEGLLDRGRLETLALFDKPDPLDGPLFAETLYVTPSELPASMQRAIGAAVADAAQAIGLCDGPVHAELRVGGDRPVVIELAARSIGGLCGRMLRFGAGIALEEVVIAHAVGLDLGRVSRSGDPATGVYMLPVPAAGVLVAIDGVAEARAEDGIRDVVITARVGDPMVPLPEGSSYLGFVFAGGLDPASVVAALRRAEARLGFTIRPRL